MQDRCCERVWHRGEWSSSQCSRAGVIERDGRWYCKQHDPVRLEEREREENKEIQKQMDVLRKQRRIQGAERKVVEAAELMESEPFGYYSKPPMRAVTGYVVKCSTFTSLCEAVRELKAARGE